MQNFFNRNRSKSVRLPYSGRRTRVYAAATAQGGKYPLGKQQGKGKQSNKMALLLLFKTLRPLNEASTRCSRSLGMAIQNGTLANAQIQALIIIYKKSILPKLIFGMAAFATTKQEDESFEKIVRQIIRNFANLPISTAKVALYMSL